MSNLITYFSIIENGRFGSRILNRVISELEGQRVEVTIRKRRSYRTHAQNAAFHGPVLGGITKRLRELGWTGADGTLIRAKEVKELLKFRFLQFDVIDPETGVVHTLVKDTRTLTKSEFADFITDCLTFADRELQTRIVIGWDEVNDEGFTVE